MQWNDKNRTFTKSTKPQWWGQKLLARFQHWLPTTVILAYQLLIKTPQISSSKVVYFKMVKEYSADQSKGWVHKWLGFKHFGFFSFWKSACIWWALLSIGPKYKIEIIHILYIPYIHSLKVILYNIWNIFPFLKYLFIMR